jgi:hypothetical protein
MATTITHKTLLDAAREYAEASMAVFPLVGKKPLTGNGFKDATTDPDQLQAWRATWPEANIGLPVPDGVVVFDIDPRHSGTLETLGSSPETAMARTGGDGWHIWSVLPDNADIRGKSGLEGVDIRKAGNYLVVAPSVHESGQQYTWERSPFEHRPAPIPSSLLQRIAKPGREMRTITVVQQARTDSWLAKAVSRVENEGEPRNDTGFWLACQLRDDGIDEDDAELVILDYRAQVADFGDHEYTEQEALNRLRQAYSQEPREPALRPIVQLDGMLPELEFTDTGNARRLAVKHRHGLRYVKAWGWLGYVGGRWQRSDGQAVQCAKAQKARHPIPD